MFRFQRSVTIAFCLSCLCWIGEPGCGLAARAQETVSQNADSTDFLVGKAFEEALAQNISVTWQAQDLRSGLRSVANVRRIAVLIDRRVDPSTELTLQVKSVTLRELFDTVAAELSLGVSQLENAIMIGPRVAMQRLRTDIEIASSQLVRHPAGGTRTSELLHRESLLWPDLTSPRELLDEISRRYDLRIENPELVTHDLWAAGALPSSNAAEILLAVLAQFDLSFVWSADLKSVRLVTQPEAPTLEREFTLRRGVPESIVDELRKSTPGLEIELRGRKVVARGFVEQLEQIHAALFPSRDQPDKRATGPKRVTFTFVVPNAPLKQFMEKLTQQAGYEFDYDAEQLDKAGIRLDRAVSLKMKDATPDELFKAMFDPLGLGYELDGLTVRLRPKSRTEK
ncbi:hypothetical protein GC176_16795 [bacterium]|nr:hypothetical protein [bacterium]